MSKKLKLNEDLLKLAKSLFEIDEPYDDIVVQDFNTVLSKAWLTRQYFSIGRHSLVLPAWLHDQLIPEGASRRGYASLPVIGNTDQRTYFMLGGPSSNHEPVVDYKGGIIPQPHSYTLIFGTLINENPTYMPEQGEVEVELHEDGYPIVTVTWKIENDVTIYEVMAGKDENENEVLTVNFLRGFANHPLLATITPFDQDGITEIASFNWDQKTNVIQPSDNPEIYINVPPIKVMVLPAKDGHAGKQLHYADTETNEVACECKAASWAASFPVRSTPSFNILLEGEEPEELDVDDLEYDWKKAIDNIPTIQSSDKEIDRLFRVNAINLRLLADLDKKELTVGPSVQEETWLPAFVFQAKALERLGFGKTIIEPILDELTSRVTDDGYPDEYNQWDIQGSLVLALANHYHQFLENDWIGPKFNAIRKIVDALLKEVKKNESNPDSRVKNIMPSGNPPLYDRIYWKRDYYFIHNFWLLYIIKECAILADVSGMKNEVDRLENEYKIIKNIVDELIINIASDRPFVPAGPLMQENALMIFNLLAFYPLEIYAPNFQPLEKTLQRLKEKYMHNGGFMVYQPWNAYGATFTLLMAQFFRYIGDFELIEQILEFMKTHRTNSQGWAEGISPQMKGGAVGDSPNGLVAAEWVNLILDLFAEERKGSSVTMLKGMPLSWLEKGIKADNIYLEGNSTISLSAKISDNVLKLEYNYSGNKELYVYLVQDIREINGATKYETSTYKLDDRKGTATFKFL